MYNFGCEIPLENRVRYINFNRVIQLYVKRELDVISSTLRTKANIGAGAMLTLFDNWNPLTDSIKLLTNALTVIFLIY